ncbi:MAG: hypothetical protein KGI39_01470 [Patescibacteria group bacterium]|nr:hypothetical protein [Patescibacteria group bacterium]
MAKDEEKKGNPMSDLKWFVIIILAAWLIGKFGLGGVGGKATRAGKIVSPVLPSLQAGNKSSQAAAMADNDSKWKGMVKIGGGNASGEDGVNQEYVTLQAYGGNKEPVDITGWSFSNGKNKKLFLIEGNDKQVRGVSDKVAIPKGTMIFIPNGANPQEDIVLGPGDRAIITTGKVANGIPFEIKTSFKENICSGYIEDLDNYDFTPPLYSDCPSPQSEEGAESLDDDCYKFVRRMNSCHTPQFKDVVYKDKESLTGFVDNVGNLGRQCKNFLKSKYGYESCVANHSSDKNFSGKEWRVFLKYPRELWAKDREVITLYDREGKIVDRLIYGY